MDSEEVLSIDDVDIESQPDESPRDPPKKLSSGLTFVLPSLKSLQQAKAGKKSSKSKSFTGYIEPKQKRPPRPVKLKPLKEVLAKLIANIKKKDDYGFFLVPVDVSQVSGYTDVVKTPMDFGTISNKVARGRYRSLDDFTNDVRLVTSNAKLFNPPGTIYHTEAEKIENWALEHIEKASSTVIQYETDWNIEVDKEDTGDVNIDEEVDPHAPPLTDIGTPGPSDLQGLSGIRRSARGPYKKNNSVSNPTKGISESIDAEGRMPGSKDGLGAFPAGSDWAKTMLDLKLKGKRYKTKKERMRIEKEGPPFRTDGSSDYYEMEDPFSVLSALVPDPQSRPFLTPVYNPAATNHSQPQHNLSQSQTPQPSASFPIPVNVSHNRPPFEPVPPKGRHWVVTRNTRKGKERDDENDENRDGADWNIPREAHATDFGTLALLAGELAEELKRRGIPADDEQTTLELVRQSLDSGGSAQPPSQYANDVPTESIGHAHPYWSTARAAEAEDHLRDLVYGGVDGFAYVRSLAEFVNPPEGSNALEDSSLGTPLAQWVEQNVVDPMTGHRHALLRETARQLHLHPIGVKNPDDADPICSQISRSIHLYPQTHQALLSLLQLRTQRIDMGALIKIPEEIYLSEKEWFGNQIASEQQIKKEDGMDVDVKDPPQTSNRQGQPGDAVVLDNAEKTNRTFSYVASALIAFDRERKARQPEGNRNEMKVDGGDSKEDPVLRNIRLNLLSLAKRAPLDTVAMLPRNLVPESIRHVIPTLASS